MLQLSVIGRIGANAEVKESDGRKFVSFNVAHSDVFTDSNGVRHESTTWVSCALNGDGGNLLPYLVAGANVCVIGDASVRVYSSAKDHAMKAGLNLRVRSIELVGGMPELVPGRLYDADGIEHRVNKAYYVTPEEAKKFKELVSARGDVFVVDKNGFVWRKENPNGEVQK